MALDVIQGTFNVPGLFEEEAQPQEQEVQQPEPVEQPAEIPAEPTEEVVETPPIVESQPEPVQSQEVNVDELIKQRLGRDAQAIESELKEAEALKKRTFLEDEELLPDDDWLKDFVRTYKRGGDVLQYLELTRTDFSKMSAEEVVKYDIRKNNEGAPDSVINRKFRETLATLGNSEELEIGSQEHKEYQEALAWEADRLRNSWAEKSKKFAIPERKQPESKQPDNTAELQAQAAAYIEQLVQSAPVQEMVNAKALKFGDFSFAVDPNEVVSMLKDDSKLFSHFLNPDGTQNTTKYLKWIALARDPDQTVKAAITDAVAKAKVEWLKEIKNPSTPAPVEAPAQTGVSVKWIGR